MLCIHVNSIDGVPEYGALSIIQVHLGRSKWVCVGLGYLGEALVSLVRCEEIWGNTRFKSELWSNFADYMTATWQSLHLLLDQILQGYVPSARISQLILACIYSGKYEHITFMETAEVYHVGISSGHSWQKKSGCIKITTLKLVEEKSVKTHYGNLTRYKELKREVQNSVRIDKENQIN